MLTPLKKIPKFARTSFIAALLCFAGANLIVDEVLQNGTKDLPEHDLCWWKTKAYNQIDKPPDVVLMGSCLLSFAISFGDARHFQRSVDPIVDEHCRVIEEELKRALGQPLSTFNYSLSGMMMSDAFALTRVNFTKEKHPKILVLCLAPRDFLDNFLPNVLASPPAHYMNKISSAPLFPSSDVPNKSFLDQQF